MRLSLLVPLLLSSSQGATPAEEYAAAVLATSPLRYNKLNEGSGTTVVDSSGNAYTGTYTGVTWDGTLSPFGEPVPFFDGANDYGNLVSAAFGTAFDLDEFTILLWFKANAAGVWTDGIERYFLRVQRDGSNQLLIRKSNTNNTIALTRIGSGTSKAISIGSQSDVGDVCMAFSCSVTGGGLLAAGELRAYKNGVQFGTTQTGNVADTGSGLGTVALGAANLTPTNVWHGYLNNLIIWNRPIDAGILALMTV